MLDRTNLVALMKQVAKADPSAPMEINSFLMLLLTKLSVRN